MRISEDAVKLLLLVSITISFGVFMEVINIIFFWTVSPINFLLHFLTFLLVFFPPFFFLYLENVKKVQIEENFINLLKDLVESVKGGMNLYQAFQHVKNNNYKALTPLVKKTANRLALGIPFENCMELFAKETKSSLIARIVASLIESQRFGGNIIDTMESLSQVILEIEKMREERKTFVSGQLITGYLIFFVFIAIIIGMDKFLFPQLAKINIGGGATSLEAAGFSGVGISKEVIESFKPIFRDLIIIQGVFSGLLVGKMAEGSIINGFKHSLIFTSIGILAYLASQLI